MTMNLYHLNELNVSSMACISKNRRSGRERYSVMFSFDRFRLLYIFSMRMNACVVCLCIPYAVLSL